MFGIFLLACISVAFAASGAGKRIEGALNVHLVPHTHDDVGWLKTVDQYFYGANNSIQDAGVQYILDTVIEELRRNPNRKFIYVEQAFFQRWWEEQDHIIQEEVKRLVRNGQLEFINGGWCMHDEAATHYVAMVDQTTLGHRRILEQFGAVPKIGWQIDPFGHSATQASLLSARVGFIGLFFARIDYQDSDRRALDKDYEMIWRPSPSLGHNGQVFTGAFERNGYGPPQGFDWDIGSWDAPIQDDERLEDYNVPQRVNDFVAVSMDQFSVNKGNDIMFTLGSDFQYSGARTWFKNLDKLIDHVNKDGRVNAFYSTPTEYTKAKLASGIKWTVKTDDFFPYADCPHCYWTGYFTSRTALKRYVRINSHYLNFARQTEVLAGGDGHHTRRLDEAMGVAQHHDGVSGTSKQHVAYDYARRIGRGHDDAEKFTNAYFTMLVDSKDGKTPTFEQCQLVNQSICPASQKNQAFAVVLYNSLARTRSELVELPVTGPNSYVVYDNDGRTVPSQTVASFAPFPKEKPAPYVLYFKATVAGLGWTTYFVQPGSSRVEVPRAPRSAADYTIENNHTKITFSSTTMKMSAITNKKAGITSKVAHDFLYYAAYAQGDQNSGAYIFRPANNKPYAACSGSPLEFKVVQGPVLQEIRAVYCDWIGLTVRLLADEPAAELQYHISSIPISDGIGKEVISRFSSDVASAGLVYTDSNGREFLERKLNYRPTWNLTVNEPVAGNYYPINAAAYIKDTEKQFSVLTDRSVGGGSIENGQLEIMIQRRLLADDSRGVGEPLNETDGITPYPSAQRIGKGMHVTGSQYLLLDHSNNGVRHVRTTQSRVFQPLIAAITPMMTGAANVQKWIATHTTNGTAISADLPVNVELMTLQHLGRDEHLLRLSHQFAVGEDPAYSKPVTVDLKNLFKTLHIIDVKEVSLTANQPIENIKVFEWNTEGENAHENNWTPRPVPFRGDTVTIDPMDVRTFSFKVSNKK